MRSVLIKIILKMKTKAVVSPGNTTMELVSAEKKPNKVSLEISTKLIQIQEKGLYLACILDIRNSDIWETAFQQYCPT